MTTTTVDSATKCKTVCLRPSCWVKKLIFAKAECR